ncbi:stationary-phase-induced ribosome-associated protein [Xenorhabdus bovienii]|uniref:Stationary-phase-induced ribosome-associated protein n=3 Tax=Xenorhabdus bovienii TaxID=40576 RepID=A0A077NC62_XENBV|nr:stationary-phase-induced ribosome-associated protein [Xenorhabdus bovienii]CDG96544.1 hypothetical protein XBP1_2170009 [Xenorhabdus bovienii str. puntauvense]CDH01097.1 hypothetical protein XBFM1_1980005 [Xenorhabdus bovienii str. feltiae Moldova]CDH25871.1 hypothetical protein XBKB1_4220007 [Xenorhabdus bovienii str. kraussei Becker Underwood]
MLSNRAARRLLGMPHKLSNSKRKVIISLLNLTTSDSKHQIPEHLRHSSFVCMKKDAYSGIITYHPGNTFYSEHLNTRR